MFFDNWSGLWRVLLVGTLAYAALILMLRVLGKRSLMKMNAFDFVVTVALGSTLATVVLTKGVALVEGLLAFALLLGLQWIVAWLCVRSVWLRGLVKGEPRLLAIRGQLLKDAMRSERVSAEDLHAALRSQGHRSLESVHAVILETDGSISVITGEPGQAEGETLQFVNTKGAPSPP